jgi:hypothetical protein
MRLLMPQPAYAEHHFQASLHRFNSNTPPRDLYTEIHIADWWWWKSLVRKDTPAE